MRSAAPSLWPSKVTYHLWPRSNLEGQFLNAVQGSPPPTFQDLGWCLLIKPWKAWDEPTTSDASRVTYHLWTRANLDGQSLHAVHHLRPRVSSPHFPGLELMLVHQTLESRSWAHHLCSKGHLGLRRGCEMVLLQNWRTPNRIASMKDSSSTLWTSTLSEATVEVWRNICGLK